MTDRRTVFERTDVNVALVRALQDDIPLVPEPFAEIGRRVGLGEAEVLDRLTTWKKEGVVRRYGAAVRHYRLGYVANGMSVWSVPPERVEEVGKLFAARPEVSHCYERSPIPGFPYNVFAMIHGREKGDVERAVAAMAEISGIAEHDILWSTREFKRDSMFYFVEED
jgi:DNA-binding Lrp family transcriptional regulator